MGNMAMCSTVLAIEPTTMNCQNLRPSWVNGEIKISGWNFIADAYVVILSGGGREWMSEKKKHAWTDLLGGSALLSRFRGYYLMESSAVKSGALVSLQDLHPSSPYFKQGTSLRVTGKLQKYSVETAIAVIVDGSTSLKINTQHLRDLSFRLGSIYQFIGELLLQTDNEAVLQACVGRNVDGMDLNLYHQSLQLLNQFQANHLNKSSS
ncbi:hypothetical protein FNV43_RR04500 [Rhamnella rubrinervis]|uniref:CST complex subunit TEN1 n=1 Tax=Rhamnella rubrinervis TaxID=2594499 RepID=A0A8K0HL52_9ROSA|nr:hypothetical protein FNV43_RR04500 [Rhamnella rubrinervis]